MKPIYARNYVLYSGEFSLQAKEFTSDFGEVVPFWLGTNLAEVEESLKFLKAEVYADNYPVNFLYVGFMSVIDAPFELIGSKGVVSVLDEGYTVQIPGVANFESKLSKVPPSRLREELGLVYGFFGYMGRRYRRFTKCSALLYLGVKCSSTLVNIANRWVRCVSLRGKPSPFLLAGVTSQGKVELSNLIYDEEFRREFEGWVRDSFRGRVIVPVGRSSIAVASSFGGEFKVVPLLENVLIEVEGLCKVPNTRYWVRLSDVPKERGEVVFLFSQVPNPKLVDNLYEFFDRIEGYSLRGSGVAVMFRVGSSVYSEGDGFLPYITIPRNYVGR